jgi:mRNA-degrading endonuclease toxin of MazEF toxin-antitoxin module
MTHSDRIKPGEVWFADLGMVEKSRPVLVLAVPPQDGARALVVVAPLTSQIRGKWGEVPLGKPRWLPKISAVNVQGLASLDKSKLVRRMGEISTEQREAVKKILREMLGL